MQTDGQTNIQIYRQTVHIHKQACSNTARERVTLPSNLGVRERRSFRVRGCRAAETRVLSEGPATVSG